MKRNLLAIAIPALLVAGAANAAEVYNASGTTLDVTGRVHAFSEYKDGSSWSDSTTARFGLLGSSKINNDIKAFGKVEYETSFVQDDELGKFKARYAFAGVDFGTLGKISYGKNDGVLTTLTDYTDTLPENGAAAGDHVLLSSRTAKLVTYANSDFFGAVSGLDFALQYAGQTLSGDENSATLNTSAYGLNAQYAIGDTGLTIGAGYSQAEKATYAASAHTIIAAVKYDANDIYLSALYANSKTREDINISGFEVAAKYSFGDITPVVAYFNHQSDTNVVYANYADVGVEYALNKNLSAIVDYQIPFDKKAKNYSSEVVNLGLIYNF